MSELTEAFATAGLTPLLNRAGVVKAPDVIPDRIGYHRQSREAAGAPLPINTMPFAAVR